MGAVWLKRGLLGSAEFGGLEDRVDHKAEFIAARLNGAFGLSCSLLALFDLGSGGVDGFADATEVAHGRKRTEEDKDSRPDDYVGEWRMEDQKN